MTVAPFKLFMPSGRRAPIVAHIPHASTFVPLRVRQDIVLDDEGLRRELTRLTDWHADHLFSWVLDLGGSLFVNTVSRLAFDPERFVDDADEPMAAVGQGVVYTRTTDGGPMAIISLQERARRIREFYEPYHEGLTSVVASMLEEFGTAIILDCHSFSSTPLPSDLDQDPDRPDICIGTDGFHTSSTLADGLQSAFDAEGLVVQRDRPFAGTLIPLAFLRTDPRVQSVMIEVRRGLYCDESTGERNDGYNATRGAVERAVTVGVFAVLGLRNGEAFLTARRPGDQPDNATRCGQWPIR